MQLHRPGPQREIAALGAQLLVVSFAPLAEVTEWVTFFRTHYVGRYYKEHDLELPEGIFQHTRFLADPERRTYHAYGLGRHSIWKAYGPKIVWIYLKFIANRRPLRMPGADTLQKGGDFVVNREMRLTLAHIGRDQSDRPECEAILAALRA
jgi:hypothetical protein